jgi:hypothetical protein
MSVLQGGTWQPVTNLGTNINSSSIDFSPALSPDGQEFYFASLRGGNWDIWMSAKTAGQWGPAIAVTAINSTDTEMHPFVSSDGQKLYFTSNRTGGTGGNDIYVSEWLGTEWGTPQLIPGDVNTASDENHPSITADGQELYFSSTRTAGYGGPDIWMSQWTGSQWGIPYNLGNVVNSGDYDQFPAISGDGLHLAFVSDRAGGSGNFDIWESSYQPTTDLSGIVYLDDNPPDLSGTVVAVGALMDITDSLGQYFLANVPQTEITLVAFHDGYTPYDTVMVGAGGTLNIRLFPGSNPTTFFDDFESGIGNWYGSWGLTEESFHSAIHSLTDSPGSNYSSNQNVWQAMVQGVDLSSFQSADLIYWTKYELETGFDYAYLEVSTNSGASWTNLITFNGTQNTWVTDTVDIGGYAGMDDVRFRFRLTSDGELELDGLYIDDFQIVGGHEDLTPPLVLHTPDPDTTSWVGDVVIAAEITDVSGVQAAHLLFSVDGSFYTETDPDSIVGDMYYFTIPGHGAGTWTEYYFHTVDNATPPNAGDSETFAHIFGTILYYDDGEPEYIYEYGPNNQIAVWFSAQQSLPLAAIIFRFYQDDTHDLDTVDVYVWANAGGYPAGVELGPLPLYPVNTLETPQAWTRIDMRPYQYTADPEFHAGCQFRSILPVILGDSPASSNRSQVFTTSWGAAGCDFHMRAVVGEFTNVPDLSSQAVPTSFRLHPIYPNPFNATCNVPFAMQQRDHIQLVVHNILGQKVATLYDGIMETGEHRLIWSAQNQATGIYFFSLKSMTNSSIQTPVQKVLLLK